MTRSCGGSHHGSMRSRVDVGRGDGIGVDVNMETC
jgi:hypothetical protein